MKVCRNDLNGFKSGGSELRGDPLRGALNIRLVFGLGAYARNAQKFTQFRQMLVAATFYKFGKVHRGLKVQVLSKLDKCVLIYSKMSRPRSGRGAAFGSPKPHYSFYGAQGFSHKQWRPGGQVPAPRIGTERVGGNVSLTTRAPKGAGLLRPPSRRHGRPAFPSLCLQIPGSFWVRLRAWR